jgi:hypothetical protein
MRPRTAVDSRAAKDGSDGVDDPLVRLLGHGPSLPRASLRYEPAQHVGLSVSSRKSSSAMCRNSGAKASVTFIVWRISLVFDRNDLSLMRIALRRATSWTDHTVCWFGPDQCS